MKKEMGIIITFNRPDGSERAKFDNFDDAIIFAKEISKGTQKERCAK